MRIYRLSSGLDSKEIDKKIADLEILKIKTEYIKSKEEIDLAYYLAKKTMERGTNIAKKFKYEFLLFLSGKGDIKSALKMARSEDSDDFILIDFSKIPNILKLLGAKEKRLDIEIKADPLDLERISLSRIKN